MARASRRRVPARVRRTRRGAEPGRRMARVRRHRSRRLRRAARRSAAVAGSRRVPLAREAGSAEVARLDARRPAGPLPGIPPESVGDVSALAGDRVQRGCRWRNRPDPERDQRRHPVGDPDRIRTVPGAAHPQAHEREGRLRHRRRRRPPATDPDAGTAPAGRPNALRSLRLPVRRVVAALGRCVGRRCGDLECAEPFDRADHLLP